MSRQAAEAKAFVETFENSIGCFEIHPATVRECNIANNVHQVFSHVWHTLLNVLHFDSNRSAERLQVLFVR